MPRNELTLAADSRAAAIIVVGEEATAPERHAAQELAEFLQQATGAQFDVVGRDERGRPRLLVGPDAARLADPAFTAEGLGAEGIVIRTVGQDLILAGGRPRGTLYAVYTFLEGHVGVRWWSSKVTDVPRRPALTVGPLDVRYVPPLEYREAYWADARDGDWAARSRCNGNGAALEARHGGKCVYEGFVHTFYPLIPPEKYFAKRPEWFSMIDGKRTHKQAQLCLTNEAMRKELVGNLRARLRENPAATIASVSQNDWYGNCQCPACRKIDEAEGSPSGSLLHFVNAVAADIEKDFPHVAISTLAYQYTRKPPRHVRPRKNVIVRLCSIECSFSMPLSSPRNGAFGDDLRGWAKICERLYVWDYTTDFRNYIQPHPNLRVLGPNVKFFAGHNVRGLFEQGAYNTAGAEMAELRAWVLAKLLWDPKLDADKLIGEFLAGYYGPAGKHVAAYLKVTHDAVEAAGDHLGCFSPNDAKFLSLATLAAGWEHLKQAEAAVADDPDLLRRVKVAQLPVLYVFLTRWDELRGAAKAAEANWPVADSAKEVLAHFIQTAKEAGITRLNEWEEGFDDLVKIVANAGLRK